MAAANGTGTAGCWSAKKRGISRADRGRWVQLRGLFTASRLLGSAEAKSPSLKEKKSEDPMAKRPLI